MSYRPRWVLATLLATTLAPLSARAEEPPPVEVHVLDDDEVEAGGERAGRGAADERASEEAALDDDAEAARARIAELRAAKAKRGGTGGAGGADGAATAGAEADDESCHGDGPWFWRKPTGARQGDLLLTWRGGVGSSGGFAGGAVEWLLSDRFGLRLAGTADGVGADAEWRRGFTGWSFDEAAWGIPSSPALARPQGFVALVEPSATFHLFPGQRFDVFATAGVSGFAYRLDTARGGSLLAHVGVGAQWFWRALFVGAEVGWYPLEIARVTGRREDGVDIYRVDRPDQPFDPRRATFVAHVGLRL